MTGEHNIDPVRQRFAKAFKRFPAHDHNVANRLLFEPFKILGQTPGDFVPGADHPVQRHGADGLKMFHSMADV